MVHMAEKALASGRSNQEFKIERAHFMPGYTWLMGRESISIFVLAVECGCATKPLEYYPVMSHRMNVLKCGAKVQACTWTLEVWVQRGMNAQLAFVTGGVVGVKSMCKCFLCLPLVIQLDLVV